MTRELKQVQAELRRVRAIQALCRAAPVIDLEHADGSITREPLSAVAIKCGWKVRDIMDVVFAAAGVSPGDVQRGANLGRFQDLP